MTEQEMVVREMVDAAEKAGWDRETKVCELRMACNVFLILSQQGGLVDSLAHLARAHKSKAAAGMLVALAEGSIEVMPIMEEAALLMDKPVNMKALRSSMAQALAAYRSLL